MARQSDITALIAKAEQQLQQIMKEYDAALHAQTIAAPLKVDIKNYCENLRSVLDYLAHSVREKYCPKENPKDIFYFPITPDVSQYKAQMTRSYPGLQIANAAVWQLLERCQPYCPDFAWLASLNKVNNENKHGALVAQVRREAVETRVDVAGGGTVSWTQGVFFSGNVSINGIPIDPRTQLPVPDPRVRVTKTTWVDFHFQDVGVSAIALLRDSLRGTKAIASGLEPHL